MILLVYDLYLSMEMNVSRSESLVDGGDNNIMTRDDDEGFRQRKQLHSESVVVMPQLPRLERVKAFSSEAEQ